MQQVIADFGEVSLFGHPFGLRIYGYGLMLVLGFLCAIFLARWRARRFGESPEAVTTLGLLALVGGVIGSRLAFVVEKWNSQFAWRRDPLPEILNITSGGLIYYGGAALAVVLMLAYLLARRMPVRRYLDIIAPALMVGLAFGRMGCLLNGCCYGRPAREGFALGIRFPYAAKPLLNFGRSGNLFAGASPAPAFVHQAAVPPEQGGLGLSGVPAWLLRRGPDGQVLYSDGGEPIVKLPAELSDEEARQALALRSLPVLPAQPLGAANALLLAGVLLVFSRFRSREGQVFALLLILYPVTRFVLESVRGDNFHNVLKLALTHNQYSSMGMMTAGLLLWLVLGRLPASAGPSCGERLAAAEAAGPAAARQRKGKRE